MNKLEFTVIDKKTGSYPNVEKIALKEDWAKHLCYCDIDCFAICEDGTLILTDDCGRSAVCPSDRFEVIFENSRDIPEKPIEVEAEWAQCPTCGGSLFLYNVIEHIHNNENTFCEHCGQKLDWGEEK